MTPVDLANLALGWLGEPRIVSFEDPSKNAGILKAAFPAIRDAVLEARDWTFATERFDLAPDAALPAFGYAARFALPGSVLRVVSCEVLEGSDLEWVREGAFILTRDAAPRLFVKGIVRVEDSSLWSPGFAQALAARLAADLCVPLTENRAVGADLWALYERKLKDAAANDGRQGRSQQLTRASSITRRRME